MLIINLPHSMWDYKISGVYRILFTDGSFYIGGSNHIRRRASSWNDFFRTGKGVAGFDIGTKTLNKIKEGLQATLDIIELCSVADLREKEAFYLFENKDNPLMLSVWDNGAWKPVLQYNKDGVFVKRYMSISSAAKYVGSPIGRIQDVLNGIRKAHKGSVFIYEKDYGERRKTIIKSRYIRNEKKGKRNVVMCSLDNKELKQYKTIVEAAKENNISTTSLTDAINGRQKTSKGFIWKYA